MPIVRDIKSSNTKKTLNLNKGKSSANKNSSDRASVGKPSRNILDLNCNKIKSRRLRKSKRIVDVSNPDGGSGSGDYLLFSKEVKEETLPGKGRKDLHRFVIAAVITIVLFNLFNIGAKVADIAKDVEANALMGYQRLVEGGKDAADMNLGGAVQYFDSASYSFSLALDKVLRATFEARIPM